MSTSPFQDRHGRKINYLRLSITDRCNLRCTYCGLSFRDFIPQEEVLTYEEHLQLITLARSLGVSKIRLTGGEPFARRDFLTFVSAVAKRFPDLDLRVTTNGTLIPDRVREIEEAGLTRLNISLDTLDRETYYRLCGKDLLPSVFRTIENALRAGLRIKINTVAMRGINDGELPEFIHLARTHSLDVRFIECMPVGNNSVADLSGIWTAKEIVSEAKRHAQLTPVAKSRENSGPARVFELKGGRGRLGVISPLSQHFCASCNRFRITSDGRLRTCLFSSKEYRLKPVLRHGRLGAEQARLVMRLAAQRKPAGHQLGNGEGMEKCTCWGPMSSIGG